MRKILTSAFLLSFFVASSQGILKESLSLDSKVLKMKVEYSIYLPHDYEATNRQYPVLYLLHGYTDDETAWTQFGEVKKITDGLIGDPEVTDMIIAMPDAGVTWYLNSYDGKTRYEDFFIREFIPFIEATYRGGAKKESRAIAGLSMGGHGTLIYALKHPHLFAAAAPLSASVWTEEKIFEYGQDVWDEYFGFIYGPGNAGKDRLTDHLKSNATLFIIENSEVDDLKQVRYYIDCGDDDFLIKGNMDLHALMLDKNIPHEFRIRDGAHNWTYWRTALPEVLKFVSTSFHR